MTVFAFGPRWPSELVKDAVWVKVPVGRTCVCCMGVVREGDQGVFVGYHDQAVNVAEPCHIECWELANVSGGAPNANIHCGGNS